MTTPTHPLTAVEQALADAPDLPNAWIPLRRETVAALLSHLTRTEKKIARMGRMAIVAKAFVRAWESDDPDEADDQPSMGVQIAHNTLRQIETAMQPAQEGPAAPEPPAPADPEPAQAAPEAPLPNVGILGGKLIEFEVTIGQGASQPPTPEPPATIQPRTQREEALDELRRLAVDGMAPTVKEWDARRQEHILPAAALTRTLGRSWRMLVRDAGLKEKRFTPTAKGYRHTEATRTQISESMKRHREQEREAVAAPPAPAVPRRQPVPLAAVTPPSPSTPSQQLTMTVRKLPKIDPDVLRTALATMAESEYGFLPTAQRWDKEKPEELPTISDIIRALGLKDMQALAKWAGLSYSPPANREGVLRAVAKRAQDEGAVLPVTA